MFKPQQTTLISFIQNLRPQWFPCRSIKNKNIETFTMYDYGMTKLARSDRFQSTHIHVQKVIFYLSIPSHSFLHTINKFTQYSYMYCQIRTQIVCAKWNENYENPLKSCQNNSRWNLKYNLIDHKIILSVKLSNISTHF